MIFNSEAFVLSLCSITGLSVFPGVDCHPIPTQGPPNGTVAKRWYGVPQLPPPGGEKLTTTSYPWPLRDGANGPYQPIWYCFGDDEAVQRLGSLVDQAIGKWAPAFADSTLAIELHPDCNGDKAKCLCDDLKDERDALVLDVGNIPQATTGYDYNTAAPFRHWMTMGPFGPGQPDNNMDVWALSMAHEFGHVLGLGHEHQRPDRSWSAMESSVDFYCERLARYDDVEDNIMDVVGEPSFEGVDDPVERMELVCESWILAGKYFPIAQDFVEGGDPKRVEHWGYGPPEAVDLDSIMIYGSFAGAGNPTGNLDDSAVLIGIIGDGTGNQDERRQIYQGGNADKALAGPSPGDIDRVKTLYPKGGL